MNTGAGRTQTGRVLFSKTAVRRTKFGPVHCLDGGSKIALSSNKFVQPLTF